MFDDSDFDFGGNNDGTSIVPDNGYWDDIAPSNNGTDSVNPSVYPDGYGGYVDGENNPVKEDGSPVPKTDPGDDRDVGGGWNPVTGNSTLPKGSTGIGDIFKKLFTNKDGSVNLQALAGIGGGIAGLLGAGRPNITPTGYQGKIPQYTATRTMAQPVPFDPSKGAKGADYGGDMKYEEVKAAQGGIMQLSDGDYLNQVVGENGYALGGMAKGRYLQGTTDGMADELRTSIDGHQPAALSHGEFVMPADVVSHLGNGNSDAGAKKLYQMMDRIRQARTGTKKQGKEINPDKFMFGGGLTNAYANGGSVQHFVEGGAAPSASAAAAGVTGTEGVLSNWAGPYVTNMLGQAQALANAPYQSYGGQLTAGYSPLQSQAFQSFGGLQTPGSIGSAASTAGSIAQQAQNMPAYQAGQFTNQFQSPQAYQSGQFKTGEFDEAASKKYMNPYLQSALNPAMEEARRQAGIGRMADAGRLAQTGAFGGSRQAIMESEGNRNLMGKQNEMLTQGYSNAFDKAAQNFQSDQARNLQAQQMGEQSRQFGAGQGLSAAQSAAQYGLAGQQLGEQSRQFGANQGLQSLNTALQAANAQGQLGGLQNQSNLSNLQAQLGAGNTQRAMEQQGLDAQKAQFEEARNNPYKMLQFQQSMLSGLPITGQSYNMSQPSGFQQALSGAGGLAGLFGNKSSLTMDDLSASLKKLGINI
jgi:hypothetical protein